MSVLVREIESSSFGSLFSLAHTFLYTLKIEGAAGLFMVVQINIYMMQMQSWKRKQGHETNDTVIYHLSTITVSN